MYRYLKIVTIALFLFTFSSASASSCHLADTLKERGTEWGIKNNERVLFHENKSPIGNYLVTLSESFAIFSQFKKQDGCLYFQQLLEPQEAALVFWGEPLATLMAEDV